MPGFYFNDKFASSKALCFMRILYHFRHTLACLCFIGGLSATPLALAQAPGLSPQAPPPSADLVAADPLKPGDRVRLTVVGFDELSGEQMIATDGTLQLPLVGVIEVGGLTPDQAVSRITDALLPYVRRPQVGLAIVSLSPIQISVTGEVLQPGPRLMNRVDNDQNPTSITLSTALLQAGGITPSADLRNIIIRRSSTAARRSDASGKAEIQVNLWQAIQTGDLAADPKLYDGDEIIVPTAQLTATDAIDQQALLSSTVAPDQIVVQVVGEVQNPGQVELDPESNVSLAVAAAGGLTPDADAEEVVLFRMSPGGQLEQQTFTFGEASEMLRSGDLIVVNQSTRGSVGEAFDFLGRIVNPILNPFNFLLRLFEE